MRFLPTSKDSDTMLNSGFIVCFSGALLMSLGYIELLPLSAEARVRPRSPFYTVEFRRLHAFSALNILTDSSSSPIKRRSHIFWSDGVNPGFIKILGTVRT